MPTDSVPFPVSLLPQLLEVVSELRLGGFMRGGPTCRPAPGTLAVAYRNFPVLCKETKHFQLYAEMNRPPAKAGGFRGRA